MIKISEIKMKKYTPKSEKIPGITFIWSKTIPESENVIEIGENVIFRPPCIIYWGTKIGDHCTISHNSIIQANCTIGNHSKIGNGSNIERKVNIGNNVSIHSLCQIAKTSVIEDNVFVGPGTITISTKKIQHGRDFPLEEKGPLIKFAARIGPATTIYPSITIGRESTIGAGSVVTHDIPDYKIAYGSPAKVVKNIPEDELFTKS
jgi:acetyltransferase-like isoleucine patch superfamily enzyme